MHLKSQQYLIKVDSAILSAVQFIKSSQLLTKSNVKFSSKYKYNRRHNLSQFDNVYKFLRVSAFAVTFKSRNFQPPCSRCINRYHKIIDRLSSIIIKLYRLIVDGGSSVWYSFRCEKIIILEMWTLFMLLLLAPLRIVSF